MSETQTISGDADLAAVGALLAEPARARILLALGDGRALPASTLASEAGIAASTASSHLGKLLDGGLLTVHAQGRHRYYALAGPHVGELLEVLSRIAPPLRVRSLREGTKAHAMRCARTCYDHLAGKLGVAVFGVLIEHGDIAGGTGRHDIDTSGDQLSAYGRDINYRLTHSGRERLTALGCALPEPERSGEIPVRYCVDWTEQAHHMSGGVGRALTTRLFDLGWVRRVEKTRAVRVTPAGTRGLADAFGLHEISTAS